MPNITHLEESTKKHTEKLSVFELKLFIYLLKMNPSVNLNRFINKHHNRLPHSLKNLQQTGIFKSITYKVEKGCASLKAKLRKPFIYDKKTKTKYIGININEYTRLQSKPSMRLYELFCNFKKSGKIYLKEEAFKNYLGISDSDYYRQKSRLIGQIIKPAIKQIEAVTGIKNHLLKVENGRVILHFTIKSNTKTISLELKKEKEKTEAPLKKMEITQIKEKIPTLQEACSIFSNTEKRKMCESLTEKGISSRVAVQALQKLSCNEVKSIYMAVEAKKTTIKYYSKYLERALKNEIELKSANESRQKNISYKQKASLENNTILRYDKDEATPNLFIEKPKRDNMQTIGNLLDQSFLSNFKKSCQKTI